MPDLRVPACSPGLLRQRPLRVPADLAEHTLLDSSSTRGAWTHWFRAAGAAGTTPARVVEFDHAYLQLAAAVEGLGVALASLPLIERDVAAGRLVCPFGATTWRAPDYSLVLNLERRADPAVAAFERWLARVADTGPA